MKYLELKSSIEDVAHKPVRAFGMRLRRAIDKVIAEVVIEFVGRDPIEFDLVLDLGEQPIGTFILLAVADQITR